MITIPIILSILFVLAIWVVIDGKTAMWVKAVMTVALLALAVSVYHALPSFFGWAADGAEIYDRDIIIYNMVFEEPTATSDGAIFVTCLPLSAEDERTNMAMRVLGYKNNSKNVRLYRLPYSRQLHEQAVKDVVPSLQRGQGVLGRIGKDGDGMKGNGKGKSGQRGDGNKGKGDGSPSHEQELKFYNLPPSEAFPKGEEGEKRKKQLNKGWNLAVA